MNYGVISFPWMLAISCWGDLGCLTGELSMMASKTHIPSQRWPKDYSSPLSPHQVTKPKTRENPKEGEILITLLEPTLLATQHEHKNCREMILCTRTRNEQTEASLHPLATQLLRTYAHVFSEELPSGLPPPRAIQHHIDLISGAVLPNKLAYRMNPKDTMEIQ